MPDLNMQEPLSTGTRRHYPNVIVPATMSDISPLNMSPEGESLFRRRNILLSVFSERSRSLIAVARPSVRLSVCLGARALQSDRRQTVCLSSVCL